jgi:antitoxin StbD
MQEVLADLVVSLSELREDATGLMDRAGGKPIAVLDDDEVVAYLLSPAWYEAVVNLIEGAELARIARSRADEESIPVSIDNL